MERVEDKALCAICGGRCCKRSPGRFSPYDLDRFGGCDAPVIEGLLDQGVVAVTGGLVGVLNSRVAPVLTLAAQGIDRSPLDLFRGNDVRCNSLGPTGCSYALDERPYECAAIVPSKIECKMPGGTRMEDLWAEHQEALREVVERRAGRSWLEEFDAQLNDRRRTDPFIQGARALVDSRGMATGEGDIKAIIDLVRSLPF